VTIWFQVQAACQTKATLLISSHVRCVVFFLLQADNMSIFVSKRSGYDLISLIITPCYQIIMTPTLSANSYNKEIQNRPKRLMYKRFWIFCCPKKSILNHLQPKANRIQRLDIFSLRWYCGQKMSSGGSHGFNCGYD